MRKSYSLIGSLTPPLGVLVRSRNQAWRTSRSDTRLASISLCGVRSWPCNDTSFDAWYYSGLATISVITTLLFITGSSAVVFWGSQSIRRAWAWAASIAFVFNSYWYVLFGSDRSELTIGYFLWWSSFAILSFGLFGLAGRPTTEQIRRHNAPLPG